MSVGEGPGPFLVQALYSFKGQNNDELVFKKGDIITVCQAEEGGWWEGTLAERTGWFPSNYVNRYTPPENSKTVRGSSPTKGFLPQEITNQQQVYKKQVLEELLDSERSHVDNLEHLHTKLLIKLQAARILSGNEYFQLIGNFLHVLDLHKKLLASLEEIKRQETGEQRVGKLFLDMAPQIQQALVQYCCNHPTAVMVLEKYKSELNRFVEDCIEGSEPPGILFLTTGLSRPFRRIDKYPSILQELSRHLEDGHPDRGDTVRVAAVYTQLSGNCCNIRRQKELELEVVTGGIEGWSGGNLSCLGSLVRMSHVSVADSPDRYLVLFPHTIILLAVTKRSSAFTFAGKMEMPGVTVEETEDIKFGMLITCGSEQWIVGFTSQEERSTWMREIEQHNEQPRAPRLASVEALPPPPPQHVNSIESGLRSSNRAVCLRPAPPRTHFCFSQDRNKTKKLDWKLDEKCFEDDALILKVIEDYCSCAKTRQTLTSGMDYPRVLIAEEEKLIIEETDQVVEEKSLVDTVYALRDDLADLRKEVIHLKLELEENNKKISSILPASCL